MEQETNGTGRSRSPACIYMAGAACVAHAVVQNSGPKLTLELNQFIAAAAPGARLTMQRNRVGFTLQRTSGVKQHEVGEATLTGLMVMMTVLGAASAAEPPSHVPDPVSACIASQG